VKAISQVTGLCAVVTTGATSAISCLRLQESFNDDFVDILAVDLGLSLRRPNNVEALREVRR
jgi:hypothetical protein